MLWWTRPGPVAAVLAAVIGIAVASESVPGQAGARAVRPGPALARPAATGTATAAQPGPWGPVLTGAPGQRSGRPTRDTIAVVSQLAADGIPVVALDAYRRAASRLRISTPRCGIRWTLLAAIGRVESDHARFAGAQLHADGTTAPRIFGIALDGAGTALIRDTDGGRLDGDLVYDRAVGPMQFIPSTWAAYASDGNNDTKSDPFNIYDAALAAARYLCVSGGNLHTLAGQVQAVMAYNHSDAYLAAVLALEATYAGTNPMRWVPTPSPPIAADYFPPVDPSPPPALRPRPSGPTPRHRTSASTATTPKTTNATSSTSVGPATSTTATATPSGCPQTGSDPAGTTGAVSPSPTGPTDTGTGGTATTPVPTASPTSTAPSCPGTASGTSCPSAAVTPSSDPTDPTAVPTTPPPTPCPS